MAGRDLDGNKKLVAALSDLKGTGFKLASVILDKLKIDSRTRLGSISEREVSEIESALNDVSNLGLPDWFLNRRKDIETGSNFHKIGPDLEFMVKSDIEREINSGSWRGLRHTYGLKVRGQRTRTSGRKGKSVGVSKLALQAAAKAKKD